MIKLQLLAQLLVLSSNLKGWPHLAIPLPEPNNLVIFNGLSADSQNRNPTTTSPSDDQLPKMTSASFNLSTTSNSTQSTTSQTITNPITTALTTVDPNMDAEDPLAPLSTPAGVATTSNPTKKTVPDSNLNKSKPAIGNNNTQNNNANLELNVLSYSIFIVYVSFVKLIYHNVTVIKRNLTEPG